MQEYKDDLELFPCQKALLETEKIITALEEPTDIVVNEHKYHCAIQNLNLVIKTYYRELEEIVDTDYYIEKKIKSLLSFCNNSCKYINKK